MTYERLLIPAFYGFWVLVALVLAWRSHRADMIACGFILLGGWIAHNFIVETQGAQNAPLLIPTVDAILALLAAYVVIFERSVVATIVFFLFVMVGLVHVAAFQTHVQGTYIYFLLLNLLFFAQVAVVGGAGGRALMADRVHRRHIRPGSHHSRA